MDKYIYLSSLYDYYGELLTEKQQHYFEDYYFNNLSLKEISDNQSISRNAVFKQLKNIEDKLLLYESKLRLHEKNKKLIQIVEKIKDEKIKKELEDI